VAYRTAGGHFVAPIFFWAVFPALAVALWELRRRQHRLFVLSMLMVPTLLYWFISRQNLVYGRYLLALVPFLAVIVAVSVAKLFARFDRANWSAGRKGAAIAVVVVLLTAAPAWSAFGWDRLAAKTSTNSQTYEWINAHVPAKAMIALEGRVLLLDETRYRVSYDAPLVRHDYQWYLAQGFDYVMLSSASYNDTPLPPSYQALIQAMEPVADFEHSDEHPGPDLRVFRIVR
jgi:hypothetical protein